jgi:hypothetical protein
LKPDMYPCIHEKIIAVSSANISGYLPRVALSLKNCGSRNALAGFMGPQSPSLLCSAWDEANIKFSVCSFVSFQTIVDCCLGFIVRQTHDRYCALGVAGELRKKLTVEGLHLTNWTMHLAGSIYVDSTLA